MSTRRRELLALKPILRAYAFGYLFSTSPSILRILTAIVRAKPPPAIAWKLLQDVLKRGTELHHFASFCATLVAGATLLQSPFRTLLASALRLSNVRDHGSQASRLQVTRLARLLAAFFASWMSFALLNGGLDRSSAQDEDGTQLNRAPQDASGDSVGVLKQQAQALLKVQGVTERNIPNGIALIPNRAPSLQSQSLRRVPLAGKTIDLTLFACARALDIVITSRWRSSTPHSPLAAKMAAQTPTALFSFSAATIMWAWFYVPHALPRSYLRWISAAASLDPRLLLALRHARYGDFVYGKETGIGSLLGSLAKECGLPFEKGDPAKTIPVSCEIVHQGTGPSCEHHALTRFLRGWIFAARMYAPIQLLLLIPKLRSTHRQSPRARLTLLLRTLLDITRSSAFLGAFISLFYYGVCLSRTRVGPLIFSRKTVTPQMWDGGLCVLGGCMLCGSSVLVEKAKRRAELMFFVLPRALGCWLPRRYDRMYLWREQMVFSVSAAVLIAAAQERDGRVRGWLGGLLGRILA